MTDGDTIHVQRRTDTTVRVIGIDTPETVDPNTPDECGGARASAAAAQLLSGSRVYLTFDPSQGRTDAYGRTLAYLDIVDGPDYGLAMIRRGLADEYTYESAYARQDEYRRAARKAARAGRGTWGKCGSFDEPRSFVEPSPEPAPAPAPGGDCAAGYSPCVPSYPPDLNCDDLSGPITVSGDDPHGLDSDGDGTACES